MMARVGAPKRSITTLLVGVAVLALTVVTAFPAAGAGASGLKYPSKTKPVPNAEPGVTPATVACPADHPHVTGGGLKVTGDESTLDLEDGTTRITSSGTKLLAVANNSSPAPAQMKVTAVCSKGTFRYPTAHKTVAPNTQGKLRVRCPSGTRVIGGAVAIGGANHKQEVASTEPFDGPDADSTPDDGWSGRANNGLTTSVKMIVQAVCVKGGVLRYVHSARKQVPNNAQVPASARCPAGTHVTGGGVDITGNDLGIEVADTFPIDGPDADHVPGDGWHANANNDGSGTLQHMRTFAICRS